MKEKESVEVSESNRICRKLRLIFEVVSGIIVAIFGMVVSESIAVGLTLGLLVVLVVLVIHATSKN